MPISNDGKSEVPCLLTAFICSPEEHQTNESKSCYQHDFSVRTKLDKLAEGPLFEAQWPWDLGTHCRRAVVPSTESATSCSCKPIGRPIAKQPLSRRYS